MSEGDVDVSRFPMNNGNRITSRDETAARLAMFSIENAGRICAGCRERKPLDAFDGHYHRNKTYGAEVFHGWHDRCRDCGGDGW